MCMTLRSLVARSVPLFWVKLAHFQTLLRKKSFAASLNHHRGSKSKQTIQPNKKGTHLEPNSPRLGTCQGWNSFTLGNRIPFQNQRFQMRLTSYTTTDTKRFMISIWNFHWQSLWYSTVPIDWMRQFLSWSHGKNLRNARGGGMWKLGSAHNIYYRTFSCFYGALQWIE